MKDEVEAVSDISETETGEYDVQECRGVGDQLDAAAGGVAAVWLPPLQPSLT